VVQIKKLLINVTSVHDVIVSDYLPRTAVLDASDDRTCL